MIKIERSNQCQSYWRSEKLYDNKNVQNNKVKIFGLTIWHQKIDYNCDLVEVENKNGIGFKK